MNTRQLKYMLEIARCESISKEAENLFISQAGLNQQLFKKEKEIGQLFERDTHHLKMTKTDAKKDIKIAFFDIDGTLIDIGTKVVSRRMLDTLIALKKNGIKICIATGRAPDRIPHFDGVEFDAFLAFNASYCFTGKEIIFSNPIPSDDVKRIIQNASELGRPVSVATAKRSAANGRDQDLIDY